MTNYLSMSILSICLNCKITIVYKGFLYLIGAVNTMKNMKIYIKIILLITFIFSLGGCYLLKQGCAIVSNNAKAKKIDNLLKDTDLDPKVRDLFLLVKKVKKFAIDEMGLRNDKNYTTFIHIDKDYLADVVSACKKERRL